MASRKSDDNNKFVINASVSEADKIRQKRDKYARKRYYTTSDQTSDRTDASPHRNKIKVSHNYNRKPRYYNSADPYGTNDDMYNSRTIRTASGTRFSLDNPLSISPKKHGINIHFLFTVLILLSFGLIMVFSSSFPTAYYKHNDGYYFINKQLMWAGVGLFVMFLTSNFKYKNYQHLAKPILIVSAVLLVFVKLFGTEINGAKRWLGIGSLSFQPSEFAKIAIIIFFASKMSQQGKEIRKFKHGFLPYVGIIAIFAGLLISQPHLSAVILIGATCVCMLLYGGAHLGHIGILGALGAGAALILAIFEPYRLARLTTFLNPYQDKLGKSYQVVQSLYAIGSGGFFGLGFTNSRQKFMYIPEPQNDFIFAIICEELGFFGAMAVIGLFILLIYQGVKIAINAPDTFSCYLVSGLITLIAFEVIINIGVVTSSMPNTGMPLPFFSAGGSNMVFLLASMGMILNVSKYTKR